MELLSFDKGSLYSLTLLLIYLQFSLFAYICSIYPILNGSVFVPVPLDSAPEEREITTRTAQAESSCTRRPSRKLPELTTPNPPAKDPSKSEGDIVQ